MTGAVQSTKTEIPRIEDYGIQGSTTEENTQSYIVERLETLANQTGRLSREAQYRPIKYNIQLRDLGDEKYKLIDPLFITMEEYPGEDLILASFPEVEIFGDGFTESEAISNIKLAILDLYDELIDTPYEELGELPKAWLNVLKQIIRIN